MPVTLQLDPKWAMPAIFKQMQLKLNPHRLVRIPKILQLYSRLYSQHPVEQMHKIMPKLLKTKLRNIKM